MAPSMELAHAIEPTRSEIVDQHRGRGTRRGKRRDDFDDYDDEE